jgi:hypothetical protein
MNQIRKISIGRGHPNEMMHYQVGKEVNLNGNVYTVTDIFMDKDLIGIDKVGYNIYIANKDGKVLWKTLIDIPVIIENNISFE